MIDLGIPDLPPRWRLAKRRREVKRRRRVFDDFIMGRWFTEYVGKS